MKDKEIKKQLEQIAARLPIVNSGIECKWKVRGSEYKRVAGITTDIDGDEIKDDDWYDYTFFQPVNHFKRLMKAYNRGSWDEVLDYSNKIIKNYNELKAKD